MSLPGAAGTAADAVVLLPDPRSLREHPGLATHLLTVPLPLEPSMSSQSGRAALVVLLAALVGALLVYLMVGNPFATDSDIDQAQSEADAYDMIEADAASRAARAEPEALTSNLAGRYAASDLGAIRLRLLDVGRQTPLPDEELLVVSRTGSEFKAVTGQDGVAIFDDLAPSRGYRLEIAVAENAPVTVQGVRVEKGKVTDLGDILLGQNVVVRGRVVDSSGRPLPGSSISVYTPNRSMMAEGFMSSMTNQVTTFPSPVEAALADDGGWFVLTALDAGSYRLEARHGGYATRFQNDVVVSPSRAAHDLTIVLGEGATVRGTVRDAQGQPIADARVVAVRDMGRRFFGSSTLERDVAVTDASGQYAIDTLAIGNSYRFGVIADEYAPIFEMSATELETKEVERDFQMALGGTITGRVVGKEDGEPLSDVSVLVAVGRMGWGGGGGNNEDQKMATGRATTDADGNFRIQNVLPGPVMTGQMKAPGYVTETASAWMGSPWGNVVAGEVLEVPLVEMTRGGVIEGTIKDATSNVAIAGAEIMIVPSERAWQVFMSGSPQAVADNEGRYELVGVAPGSYHVIAAASGYATSDPSGGGGDPVAVPEEGGVVKQDVLLTMSGYVTGVVTDSQGEPVAGARVRTRIAPRAPDEQGGRGRGRRGMNRMRSFLPGATGADLTDQTGRYRIDGVSSQDRWIVVAEADDFVESESEPFQVRAGEKKEVDVSLVGGGRIEGRVIDERGSFVEAARVRVGRLPADRAGRGRLNAWEVDRYLEPNVYFTDADGKFVAEDIPPGLALVKVEKEGYVTFYKRNVTVRPDETIENYTVSMTKGDIMEGIVRGANGQALEGAMVAITKSDNPGRNDDDSSSEASEEIEPRLSGRTEADGRFRIENIPPGVVNVVVWFAPGHQGWARDQNEKAMRKGIATDATSVEFRLEAAQQGGGMMPARGR